MKRVVMALILLNVGAVASAADYGYGCDCQGSCIGTWLPTRGGCWQNVWDGYCLERHYKCEPHCVPYHGCGLKHRNADCGCESGCDSGTVTTLSQPLPATTAPSNAKPMEIAPSPPAAKSAAKKTTKLK